MRNNRKRGERQKLYLNDRGERTLWFFFSCFSPFFLLSFSSLIFTSNPTATYMRHKNQEQKQTILIMMENEHLDFCFLFLRPLFCSLSLSLSPPSFSLQIRCQRKWEARNKVSEKNNKTILMAREQEHFDFCFLFLSLFLSLFLFLHFLFKSSGNVNEKQEKARRENKHDLHDEGERTLCFLFVISLHLFFSLPPSFCLQIQWQRTWETRKREERGQKWS